MGVQAKAASVPKKRSSSKKEPQKAAPKRRASDREVEALRNEVLGIAITVGSLAMLLSLVSFYPEDLHSTGEIHNLIGPVGAYIANKILYVLGISGFLLPITLVIPGVCFMTGHRLKVRPADAIGYPVLLLCSAIAAQLWLNGYVVLGNEPGGWVGKHGAHLLLCFFGTTGSYLMIYSVLSLTFVMTTGVSLVSLLRRAFQPIWTQFSAWTSNGMDWIRAAPSRVWEDAVDIWSNRRAEQREKKKEKTESTKKKRSPKITDRRKELRDEIKVIEGGRAKKERRNESEATEEMPLTSHPRTLDEAAETKKGFFSRFGRRKDERSESGEFSLGDLTRRPTSEVGEQDIVSVEDAPVVKSQTNQKVQSEATPSLKVVPTPTELPVAEQPVEDKPIAKPVVNRKRDKEAPVEQIEIPLPEDLQCADYQLPPLHFLDYDDSDQVEVDPEFLQQQAERLVEALSTFKIEGRVTEIHPGPVVTMFEFEPAPGVRISKIAGLADDLAMALKAFKVRIVAPIPGKGVVGFEVPSENREMVFLKEIIGSTEFQQKKHFLPMVLGKDIHGAPVVTDLAKMPHLLVAGTTGSGKSVGVNCMITSLLYHATPEEVRFIMVDPKMLELSIYEGVPHLLLPVVTDAKKASMALKWAVDEMERRYELMKNAGVRDVRGYNRKVERENAEIEAARLRAQAQALEQAAQGGQSDSDHLIDAPAPLIEPAQEPLQKIPYLVVVIDEFADLMMVAGKEVELCVARIAQKARAAGIHLILATQRPSTDVITGVIKANFPTRIAFQVSSAIDSRTILSSNGAENLLGKGDMLFMPPGSSRLNRVHGAFVSENEIHQIVKFIADQGEPDYLDESVLIPQEDLDDAESDQTGDTDPMYEEAVRVVARDGRASTSHLQRRLSLGYNRAARIVDQMERDGILGPGRGAKSREIHHSVINHLIRRWDGIPDDEPIGVV